jgi:hypothetical protein
MFVPTDEQRAIVELLTAFGVSRQAICTELVRNGVPCRSVTTLQKRFKREIEQGTDRLAITLGRRLMSLALGDGPHAFAATTFLLRTRCGVAWRDPKELADTDSTAAQNTGAWIYPQAEMQREQPAVPVAPTGPTIDATAEEAEPDAAKSAAPMDSAAREDEWQELRIPLQPK